MRRTSRSAGRGLARVESTTPDTLVAFATEAGTVAQDGDTPNSPFTSALLKFIATPGLDLRLAFGLVRDEVMKNTASRQRPFIYGSLGGSTVAIVDAAAPPQPEARVAAPPPPTSDPCSAAEAHWRSAEAIGTKAAFDDHLNRFPTCIFAGLAAARITALDATARAQSEAEQRKAAEAPTRKVRDQSEIQAEARRLANEIERKRLATLPPPAAPVERQRPAGGLDGTWTVTRSQAPGCGPRGATFTIQVSGTTVRSVAGSGSISPSGSFRVAGSANTFVGTLRGNSGGGRYSGKCTGTFTARKN